MPPYEAIPTDDREETRGKWKDGLCDCFSYGLFHPSLWCAMCFQVPAMGQIMTRLRLNALADPAEGDSWKETFRNTLFVFVAYAFLSSMFASSVEYDEFTDTLITEQNAFGQLLNMLVFLYVVYIVAKTRKLIRDQNDIPAGTCGQFEDIACGLFCTCCSISQMNRHTAGSREASCCTSDGLPESINNPDEATSLVV